jgi:hypothetical protein
MNFLIDFVPTYDEDKGSETKTENLEENAAE